MGVSRATSQAAVPSDGRLIVELLEFAVSQAVSQEGVAPRRGPARAAPALPGRIRQPGRPRAAAARAGREPAVIAAYPHAAIDPALMVQIAALLDGHPEVASDGGCLQGRVTWPGPEASAHPDGLLIAVARLPGGSSPCALILVAQRSEWPAEWQSTDRALPTVISTRTPAGSGHREITDTGRSLTR